MYFDIDQTFIITQYRLITYIFLFDDIEQHIVFKFNQFLFWHNLIIKIVSLSCLISILFSISNFKRSCFQTIRSTSFANRIIFRESMNFHDSKRFKNLFVVRQCRFKQNHHFIITRYDTNSTTLFINKSNDVNSFESKFKWYLKFSFFHFFNYLSFTFSALNFNFCRFFVCCIIFFYFYLLIRIAQIVNYCRSSNCKLNCKITNEFTIILILTLSQNLIAISKRR